MTQDTQPTVDLYDAIRKATDPYGVDGEQTAAVTPSAAEIEMRLRSLGYRIGKETDFVGYLSTADCGSVAITAMEGGIGYWAQAEKYDHQRWAPDYMAEAYARREVDHMNIEVPEDFVFYTIRPTEDDGQTYEGDAIDVTPRLIRYGVELVLRGVPNNFEARAFHDMRELDAMDSDEADWVIQLGAFGELRYG
jgi:hypothetical protein